MILLVFPPLDQMVNWSPPNSLLLVPPTMPSTLCRARLSHTRRLVLVGTSVVTLTSSGIAHTRWATHGGASDNNAHPHHDQDNRIAVCHNGVIENYAQLKKTLKDAGLTFRSETDTEVIAQMVRRHLLCSDLV